MTHWIRVALLSFMRRLPVVVFAAAFLHGAAAEAAPSKVAGAEGKRLRLHGELDALSFYHFNPDGSGPRFNGGGFGLGRTLMSDAGGPNLFFGTLLQARPIWSLGLGYVFADARAVVGAKFGFAFDAGANSRADVDAGANAVTGLLIPYFRWIFLPGTRFRPFVEGRFGFGGGATTGWVDRRDRRETGHVLWPNAGGGGGLHIFIVDSFSIDVGLMLDYFAPFTRSVSETPTEIDDEPFEKAGDVLIFSGQVGLSAWF